MPIPNPRSKPRERVGTMRERVEIQRPLELQDTDYGQEPQQWERYGIWRAHWQVLSGGESEVAQQLYAEATHRFTGRYVAGVGTQHRLIVRGQVFEIGHVDNIEGRNHDMTLLCAAAAP